MFRYEITFTICQLQIQTTPTFGNRHLALLWRLSRLVWGEIQNIRYQVILISLIFELKPRTLYCVLNAASLLITQWRGDVRFRLHWVGLTIQSWGKYFVLTERKEQENREMYVNEGFMICRVQDMMTVQAGKWDRKQTNRRTRGIYIKLLSENLRRVLFGRL